MNKNMPSYFRDTVFVLDYYSKEYTISLQVYEDIPYNVIRVTNSWVIYWIAEWRKPKKLLENLRYLMRCQMVI